MKTLNHLLIASLAMLTLSCYKPGKVQVQNNISQVKVVEVYWGDFYIASELLPGETSSEKIVDKQQEKLPSSHKVTFEMTANNRTIYLETVEEFQLNPDEGLLIVLSDDTEVTSPNQ